MRFGEILLEFLSQKNMTQDQLARELEVSSTLVNRWINKKDIAPSINRCREIAKILKLTREEENKLIEASVEERLPDEFRFLLAERVAEGTGKAIYEVTKSGLLCPEEVITVFYSKDIPKEKKEMVKEICKDLLKLYLSEKIQK